ncbi:MAG: hypothetical protein EKK55_05545 [Rhodocyclaceae bacterium]|nr:MAG: hypothetical protein EKK55_05545 [Rhodocyclaceae bacterium]
MATRSLRVVNTETPLSKLIQPSPGFEKKRLAHDHLDMVQLCEFGCTYCSTNSGYPLRMNREALADLTEEQLGERLYPATSPELTIRWSNVVAKLEAQLAGKPKRWGKGRVLVVSQLTDPLSPGLLATGIPEAVLRLILERTSFTIRLLTKSAAVLTPRILQLILAHPDRFLVGLSLGTLDDGWAKRVEVNTTPPRGRVHAIRALQDAGAQVYGMLCPIFPHAAAAARVVEARRRFLLHPRPIRSWWIRGNDERECVTVGDLRAMGVDVPASVPADGYIPRRAVHFGPLGRAGFQPIRFSTVVGVRFSEPFWIETAVRA